MIEAVYRELPRLGGMFYQPAVFISEMENWQGVPRPKKLCTGCRENMVNCSHRLFL